MLQGHALSRSWRVQDNRSLWALGTLHSEINSCKGEDGGATYVGVRSNIAEMSGIVFPQVDSKVASLRVGTFRRGARN